MELEAKEVGKLYNILKKHGKGTPADMILLGKLAAMKKAMKS